MDYMDTQPYNFHNTHHNCKGTSNRTLQDLNFTPNFQVVLHVDNVVPYIL